jgi:two-component system, sensor histidine kinase PdtaS
MSVPPDYPPSAPGPPQSRSGDTPFLLYWGTPIFIALAACGLGAFLWFQGGRFHVLAARWIWGILLAASAWQAIRQRRWDMEHHKRRLAALESLIQLSSLIGTDLENETEFIKRLPATVRTMLGMQMSQVGILEESGTILHILASEGLATPMVDVRLRMEELPITRQCVKSKYVVAVSDAQRPSGPANSVLARRLKFRAMVQIPLIFQGQIIGVMIMADERPRRFTDIDIRRAWLWGCQAAVMLANSRLYMRMNQTLQDQGRLLEHRDALYALNTALERPGTLEEVLQRIVELAPSPLEVDAALVWMIIEDDPANMSVVAVTPPYGRVAGFRLPIRGNMSEHVLGTRQAAVIEDGFHDQRINPQLCKVLPRGSLIFQPLLHGDQRPLGMLVLVREKSGPFHPDQIELSRLFSMRAAAAIEMARLNQQTRLDADAKAMLLRELNHRVKNNLASIVSLLSVNQPKLPPDARRWLNRAIERISAMAQVHELFSGGPGRVTLAELVEQTVRSLSVSRPSGVVVRIDLQAGPARLRTDRAVSLAMAVHELCFNGIVHGLGSSGVLTIRARRDNGYLTIEVEDDAGRPAALTDAGHGGIGLSLVRGLVGRELRGQFNLAATAGGAVATVQFPLLADELAESAL